MTAMHDPQRQSTPKRTPISRLGDLSCVLIPTHLHEEQDRRSEKLRIVLAELKIDLISLSESNPHQRLSVLARRLDSFSGDD